MGKLLRIVSVISVFAITAPLLGSIIFIATLAVSTPQLPPSFNPADLVYSIGEFGLPAAAAGLVFAIVAYFALGRLAFLSWAIGRATVGGAAMLAIFGLPLVHKLLVYGHLSKVLALIALLAVVIGAVLGGAYPVRFLATRHQNVG